MGRRISVGRRTLAALRVRLGCVLVLGVLLSGCGGSHEGEVNGNVPPTPEEAGSVVIRVSGAEGTAYSGNYETIEGELVIVEETTLGSSAPIDYEVEIQEGANDGVTALFEKTQPGREELRVGILADDELVAESRTFAEFGDVIVDWFPQVGPPGILQEDLSEKVPEDEPF